MSEFIGELRGWIRKWVIETNGWTNTSTFDTFFAHGLAFSEKDAEKLGDRYIAACDIFNVAPGLSHSKAKAPPLQDASMVASEFRKLAIGTFKSGPSGTSLSLRIADFLTQHKTPIAAKNALTPAKRDALRMEASKMLRVPDAAWAKYYKREYRSNGVRG